MTLSLAVGPWYVLVPGSSTIEMTYNLPVQVGSLPADLRVDDIQPKEFSATYTGPKRTFYFFDPSGLKVTVDSSAADISRKILQLSEQNIRNSQTLTLQQLNPATLRISVKKYRVRKVRKAKRACRARNSIGWNVEKSITTKFSPVISNYPNQRRRNDAMIK